MDDRRSGGVYSPSQVIPPQPQRTGVDTYKPQRSSYRRAPDQVTAVHAQEESPVIPSYTPQKIVQSQYATGQPTADVQRTSSHRRRENKRYNYPVSNEPLSSHPPPAAPDAPRAPPPSSYRGPNAAGQASAPPRGNSKSYSSHSARQPTITVPQPSAYDLENAMSPTSPKDRREHRRTSATRATVDRRDSVPDRSPLQKLEVKLDDISKEEKRARVQEAEFQAQEKAAADRRASRSNRDAAPASSQARKVCEPLSSQPLRTDNNRRNVSMPTEGLLDARYPEKGTIDFGGTPYNPQAAPNTQRVRQSRESSSRALPLETQDGRPKGVPRDVSKEVRPYDRSNVSRGASFRDRSLAGDRSDQRRGEVPQEELRDTAPTGLGLYGMDNQTEQKPVMVGRSNSRKLQKEPPWEYPSRKLVGGRDITKTSGSVENDHKPHDRAEHRYGVPYQLAGAYKARDSLSSSDASLEDDTSIPTDGLHKRFASIVHRKHEPERRYQHAKPLDEWKQAQIATLLANDMSLDAPETNVNQNHTDDKNKAWWERSGQQRRSSGSARQDLTGSNPTEGLIYDGAYEDPSGQTNFNPPLYMKCGPLLRYTGMRKETVARSAAAASTSEGREIWRGTVMIVTQDSASSYTAVPVLRLFVQPMDLMPPPPAQVSAESGQRLAPEYIDPLAGEVKVSRTGKTLFVRPVEDLTENTDLSRIEDDSGLFEEKRSNTHSNDSAHKLQGKQNQRLRSRIRSKDGEKLGKYKEVKGIRLYAERGVTFWRFSIEVELGSKQRRIAYRINRGPAIGFWVPAKGQTMNMMFHSCNGFSLSVDSNQFSGPDPMWRDVLNTHQTRPFHVMIGGGDQIYNDAAMKQTKLFQEWTVTKNALHKHSAQFTREMQDELEDFYLNRYAMWFSQGLFGMANSQIPMINIWDDHDIIDGFGSYPHHFMSTKVFTGLGAVAYKYYMLFQHQSLPEELQEHEPSWLLGDSPGPYINQLSRNLFMFLGRNVAFLGLDCRMERQRDSILTQATYDLVFDRLRREIIKGETRHLIVLLGVPIAYPRLNFLENVLTSRMMDPIKALGRTGLLGGFVNKFDGGVEILDDLDDHWTAKHHKSERNWFIQELQEIAAEKSVRITILGGDVHLAAVGQFFSNKKLGIPKDCDHRYMPNVISSAIVNTPPPDMMADILNKRNKIHHLDHETDEDMIPIFTHDVDGKPRNNQHLLPRRNWCSLREYEPGSTPPPSPPPQSPSPSQRGPRLSRTLSLTRKDFTPGGLVRRLSNRGAPPSSYHNSMSQDSTLAGSRPEGSRRRASADVIPRPADGSGSYFPDTTAGDIPRPNPFHRRPTGLSEKAALKGGGSNLENAGVINLEHGLDIVLNVEVNQHDPSGITTPYRLLVPALEYRGEGDLNALDYEKKGLLKSLFSHGKNKRSHDVGPSGGGFDESEEVTPAGTPHDHSIDPTHAHRETGDVLYDDYEYEPAKPKRRFSLFGSRKKREPDYDHDDRYDEGDRYTPSPPSGPPARAKTYSGPHSQPQRSASHRHSQPQAQAIAPPRRSVTMPRHQPQPHDPVPEPERHSYRSASVSRESADLHDERLERGHSRRAQQVMSERERGEREYLERVERERYSEGSLTPEPYPAPRKKKAGWRIFW